ncbi:hypothetical protein OG792_08195 [Micromonospora sp. NBC_01699]|uniref:hypothetical protein n=1 Tax=Micromonospora sp. NBC_01699 TaxID=2975984 RepID=UPI002E377231|nr:hypothetical protein [Micromonospora sp. NBC_01699]
MAINSTRRKWFATAAEPGPVERAAPPTTPDPAPGVVRPDRHLVTLIVGAATIGGPRQSTTGARPARSNNGRWPA